ncbi:hypothetical protein CP533_5925 [Ophiocordyceps camponoti-saundersi (nom. inval.)]|nr:hypothetical protein CP533_5925 [Ophiocordyceps camponoti-saundersi (nom. inval.)]
MNSLDVQAASIIGNGKAMDVGVSGTFANKKEVDQSTFTFLARAEVRRQPPVRKRYKFRWLPTEEPHLDYGDRFISDRNRVILADFCPVKKISGFIEGGALFAQICVTVKDSSYEQAVGSSLKTFFKAFDRKVDFSASVKHKLRDIKKMATITVDYRSVGAPPDLASEPTLSYPPRPMYDPRPAVARPGVSNAGLTDAQMYAQRLAQRFEQEEGLQRRDSQSSGYSEDGHDVDLPEELLDLKRKADRFVEQAAAHAWQRLAILDEYPNTEGWQGNFKVPDYTSAIERSWTVLKEFGDLRRVIDTMKTVPEDLWRHGSQVPGKLIAEGINYADAFRRWVDKAALKPEEAEKLPGINVVGFRQKAMFEIQTQRYYAHHWHYNSKPYFSTDVLTKTPSSDILFEAHVHEFPLLGTVRVAFGMQPWTKRDDGEDSYLCVIGENEFPQGYHKFAEFWAFPKHVPGVTNGLVTVEIKRRSYNIIRLTVADRALQRRDDADDEPWQTYGRFYLANITYPRPAPDEAAGEQKKPVLLSSFLGPKVYGNDTPPAVLSAATSFVLFGGGGDADGGSGNDTTALQPNVTTALQHPNVSMALQQPNVSSSGDVAQPETTSSSSLPPQPVDNSKMNLQPHGNSSSTASNSSSSTHLQQPVTSSPAEVTTSSDPLPQKPTDNPANDRVIGPNKNLTTPSQPSGHDQVSKVDANVDVKMNCYGTLCMPSCVDCGNFRVTCRGNACQVERCSSTERNRLVVISQTDNSTLYTDKVTTCAEGKCSSRLCEQGGGECDRNLICGGERCSWEPCSATAASCRQIVIEDGKSSKDGHEKASGHGVEDGHGAEDGHGTQHHPPGTHLPLVEFRLESSPEDEHPGSEASPSEERLGANPPADVSSLASRAGISVVVVVISMTMMVLILWI